MAFTWFTVIKPYQTTFPHPFMWRALQRTALQKIRRDFADLGVQIHLQLFHLVSMGYFSYLPFSLDLLNQIISTSRFSTCWCNMLGKMLAARKHLETHMIYPRMCKIYQNMVNPPNDPYQTKTICVFAQTWFYIKTPLNHDFSQDFPSQLNHVSGDVGVCRRPRSNWATRTYRWSACKPATWFLPAWPMGKSAGKHSIWCKKNMVRTMVSSLRFTLSLNQKLKNPEMNPNPEIWNNLHWMCHQNEWSNTKPKVLRCTMVFISGWFTLNPRRPQKAYPFFLVGVVPQHESAQTCTYYINGGSKNGSVLLGIERG